jgi:chromosome segregation ATPase
MGLFGKRETRQEMHERENQKRQETLEEYQNMFWDNFEVRQTMSQLENCPNIPYLERLKNKLNKLASETPFLFGTLKEIPSHITDERNILIMRINNFLSENIESEINFLESEIEKLEGRKNSVSSLTYQTSKYKTKDESLNSLLGMFGQVLSKKVGGDSDNLIAEFRRDIRELKNLIPAQAVVDPQRQKIADDIEKIEKEIKANEDLIEQIKQLTIPESDKKREENMLREEIGNLQLQLLKQKKNLATL